MSATPLSLVPVFMGLALHIAGCAAPLTPEAACFAEATVDYRAAWRAAEAARADLDRGYALHPVSVTRAAAVPCRAEGRLTTCPEDVRATRAVPVPIDQSALERRLAAAERRMAALRPAAMARAAPCGYAPELTRAAR